MHRKRVGIETRLEIKSPDHLLFSSSKCMQRHFRVQSLDGSSAPPQLQSVFPLSTLRRSDLYRQFWVSEKQTAADPRPRAPLGGKSCQRCRAFRSAACRKSFSKCLLQRADPQSGQFDVHINAHQRNQNIRRVVLVQIQRVTSFDRTSNPNSTFRKPSPKHTKQIGPEDLGHFLL